MKVLVHASVYMALTAEVDTETGLLKIMNEPVIAGAPHAHFPAGLQEREEVLEAKGAEAIAAVYTTLTDLWAKARAQRNPGAPAGGMVQ